MATTPVDFSTLRVNAVYTNNVDRRRHRQHNEIVKTLADRMLWVLQNRKDIVKNKSTWSTMAGLKRGTVNAVITRNGSMRADNAVELAKAAQVSIAWFTSGEGEPDTIDVVPDDDAYVERSLAASKARQIGALPSAIKTARLLKGEDFRQMRSPQWVELMLSLSLNEMRANPQATHEVVQAVMQLRETTKREKEKAAKADTKHRAERGKHRKTG